LKGGFIMRIKNTKLIRQQLDKNLSLLAPLLKLSMPQKGWVCAIKNAIGMSSEQLANILGIKRQNINRIELNERAGKVTIETMRKVSEAMNCTFVYSIVPNISLEQIVKNQATKVSKRYMSQSNQTMSLEAQGLSIDSQNEALQDLIAETLREMPKTLWDDVV
jgi:predicted DNA-binding mobile mystery protein A